MSTSHAQITASMDIYLCILKSRIHCFEFLHWYINPHPLLNFQVLDHLYIGRYCVGDYTSMDAFQSTLFLAPQTFVVNFSVENKPTKAQIQETPILFCWCPLSFFYVPHHSCSSCQTLRVSIEFWANKANPIHFTKLSQVMQFPNYHSFISCIKIRPWYTTLGNVTLATFLEEALDIHVWTAITWHRRWTWQRFATLALTFPPLINLLAKHRQ